MLFTAVVTLSFLLGTAQGSTNDWSKPCLSGVCFYDLPTAGTSSGTLKIWGSSSSITDITTAAGWEILDCKKDTLAQDIRLVCTGDSKCAHLYDKIGAVGKIARLPERCGRNAFARISRAWVPADQSIPEHIAKRLVKRDGVQPQVKALHIDTDFSSVDTARVGVINFAIQGANVPGAEGSSQSLGRIEKRQFGFVKKAISAVTKLNDVSVDKTKTLDPFSISKTFNVLDKKLSCPPLEGRLKLDVTAKANALAAIGLAAEGTIVPPKIKDFAVTATLTADLGGSINLNGGLSGAVDSGKIKLVEVGIPGLSFPGILTIGPSFRIDAQANANLDVNADLSVDINYKIDKATLVFPPNSKKAQAQGGAFTIGDTPLKLSVSPSIKATGTVTAHLIPSLNLGIDALGGVAEASVFLALDASATMKLSLEGQAQVAATVNRISSQASVAPSTVSRKVGKAIAIRQAAGGIGSRVAVSTSGSASLGGCFEIIAGLAVNAGANANFFGLFDSKTTIPLFNKEFDLLKKCFGNQRREEWNTEYTPRSLREPSTLVRRLVCPASNTPATTSLADGIVPASSIIALN